MDVVQGRRFTEADDENSQRVVIVDDQLASRLWPTTVPIGQRILADPDSIGTPDTWATVVGVVRHVRYRSLVEPLSEQIYFPLRQVFRNPVIFALRTSGDPSALAAEAREIVRSVDPRLPIYDVQPLSAYVARARSIQRFTMNLVVAFAAVAVALASVGLYGVIAFVALQRHREYGIRLALGASPRQIAALVLGEGASLTVAGVSIGALAAAGASELLRAQLFGVSPRDGLTYVL